MYIVTNENLGPKVWLAALDEIMRLLLEHGIIVGNSDELIIAKTLHICKQDKDHALHRIFQQLEARRAIWMSVKQPKQKVAKRTLFSLRNCSGLVLSTSESVEDGRILGSQPEQGHVKTNLSLLRCSTSCTSSSIGKLPVTDANKLLMVDSSQSTSSKPEVYERN